MGCKERPQREQSFQNVLGVFGDSCLCFACFSLVAKVIWCCFGLTAIGTRVNSSFSSCFLFLVGFRVFACWCFVVVGVCVGVGVGVVSAIVVVGK